MTTEKAILGCKKKDRICQKYIFDSYSATMMMVCMRYVKSIQDAEELMLGGFLKFYNEIDRFVVEKGVLAAWLKKIMVNECLMFLRKKGKLNLVDEQLAEHQTDQYDALHGITVRELYTLITSLPDGYRTVFNLYAVEGYTHKEIGQLLGIGEGTSKSQFSKARHMLQKLVKETDEITIV